MFCYEKINRNQSRVELEIQLRALDPQTLSFISSLGCSYSSIQNRLIFLIIFVTSCYVLNKIVILSEISIPEWSETGPGPRGIVVMTRRAYCLSSVRVIRWQGRASWRNRPCAPRGQKWVKNMIFEQCLETCVISVSSKNTSIAEIQIIMKNLQF